MVKEFVKGKKYRTPLGYIIEFVELDKIGDPMFKPLGRHPYSTNKLGLIEFSAFTAIKFQQLPDEAV